ncbi:hypothetical protein BC938DRAFT_473019 [Jimgerdemannia flammicorona]|uniref:ATP-dependent DNA ligase family profile domain-containing protein n=1 Tax=Jimgerdemannia flammicorona TaxID=994334 RepID=A0A433Q4X3_9FUNG|nr:hypothetical protein BC938DRAFT_473019 [Jimgerdemannia flammicorona]
MYVFSREVYPFTITTHKQRLCDHFSHVTATLREEGLVVKRTDSTYNPGRWKRDGRGACWVKMKRDYIKGLGDTADFVVVGARYRPPVPGDMLKVPPGTLNQFYIGCLENKEDVVRWDARPKFRILFTVQHGLSAKMLQALNVRLAGRTVRFEFEENPVLPYSHTYAVSALLEPRRPDVLLLEPFVVELLGSGFVRVSKYAQYYVLRFPRVTRVQEERKWKTEGVGFGELQEMAKRVVRVGDEGKSDAEEQEEFEVIGEQKGRISEKRKEVEERGEREKRRRLETKMIPKGAATQSTESSSLSTYGSIPLHAFASSANEVEPQPTGVHSPLPSSTPSPSFVVTPTSSPPLFSQSSLPSSPSSPPSPSLLFFPPTCIYHIIPSSHAAATRESMGRLGVQERNVVNTVDAVVEWVIGGDKEDRVGVVVVDRRRETVWRKVRAYVEAKVAQSGRTDHAPRNPGNAIRLLDRKVFNALIASCGERSGSGDCDSGSEARRREQMASRVIMAYELAAVNVVRG